MNRYVSVAAMVAVASRNRGVRSGATSPKGAMNATFDLKSINGTSLPYDRDARNGTMRITSDVLAAQGRRELRGLDHVRYSIRNRPDRYLDRTRQVQRFRLHRSRSSIAPMVVATAARSTARRSHNPSTASRLCTNGVRLGE